MDAARVAPRALELDGVSVSFDGRRVLHEVSLTVGAGERVALVGASGSGKSLTAAAAAGLLPAGATVSGRVLVDGIDTGRVPAAMRPAATRVGLVRQDSSVALNPSVRIGTQLALSQRRRLGRAGARAAAGELLERAAFADPRAVMRRRPGELSGGQRQRICIALALASCPGLLVADEATSALDVVTQAEVLALLRHETGPDRATLVFVTHDLAAAASLCDRAIVLSDGRVVDDGPIVALLAATAHAVTGGMVAAARRADRLLGTLVAQGVRS